LTIISRYILSAFLRVLALTTAGFVLVYLVVDFLEKIDNFLEVGLGMDRAAYFFLLSIPSIVFYMTPVAVLVAVLISLGLKARHSEIVAFKAAGVSLFRLSRPIVIAAFGVSGAMFLLSEMVIPNTSSVVNTIWDVEVEQSGDRLENVRRNIWIKADDVIIHVNKYYRNDDRIEGVSLFRFAGDFNLENRIEAASASRTGDRWRLIDGIDKRYLSGGRIHVDHFREMAVDLPPLPDDLGLVERSADEMSSRELVQWIEHMEMGGYDPMRYRVDLQMKYSFPFICVIMVLIGLPIAFWKEKGGGIALGVGVGIGLSFIYLVVLGLSRALGYSGALPPVAAAWVPNAMFTILGLLMFTHVRQ
jgi:lipopolysaccharide export system permease protein